MTNIKPASFAVFVTFPHNGKPHTMRCGNYKTLEAARAGIAEERRALGDTLGGLIEATPSSGRTYSILQATGWREVQM